jgi:hypothetical protein
MWRLGARNAEIIPGQELAGLSSTCGTIYSMCMCARNARRIPVQEVAGLSLYVWYNIQYSICGVCQEYEENSCPGSGRSLLYVWYNIQYSI